MDMIEMAREIGRALQKDQSYLKATADARTVNDNPQLAKMVSDFEEMRARMEAALQAGVPGQQDEEVMNLDEKMHDLYHEINEHPAMAAYNESRAELEHIVNHIIKIITGSANGENPDEIMMEEECTGSCCTCGGCH